MGPEWMGFLFEARPVDRQMAGDATVNPRYRLIEAVAVELVQRDLLDLGYFGQRQWPELDRGVVHHPDPFVPFRRQLGEFILDVLGARPDFLYFFLELI